MKEKMIGIFSEIDETLDFYETLVNGSVFNVVSLKILVFFLRKSLLKKLFTFKVIYFVCEENKTLNFHIDRIMQCIHASFFLNIQINLT